MTKLSPSQRDLPNLAAKSDSGATPAPDGAKASVSALIKRGLLLRAPVAEGPDHLLIAQAGRAAAAEAVVETVSDTKPGGTKSPTAPQLDRPPLPVPKGKLGTVVTLLRRDGGANIEALMAATGWQAHSVRGAMSGALKKKLGLAITSVKIEGAARLYRIVETEAV